MADVGISGRSSTPRRGPRSRRGAVFALVAAGAALLAGCAGVPSAGTSHRIEGHKGSPQAADLDRPYVRLIPPTPQPDDKPTAIMTGFQVAMADFTADHAAARSYLTPEQARLWDPDARTVIYANLQRDATGADGATFDFSVTPVAVVARDHGFSLDDVAETYDATVTRQRDGRWRLSDVKPGTMLSIAEFERAFRGVDIYFPTATGAVLVPDHVFLPVPPTDLPTAMVRQLVHGPTSWLAPAVRPVVPAGTSVHSVVIGQDGTADVALGGSAETMSGAQLRLLRAAVTWTLVGQLPDVKAVRVHVQGHPDPHSAQTPQDYSSLDPGAFPSGSRATYVDGGHVLHLEPPGAQPQPDVQPALGGATDPVAPVGARGLASVRRRPSGDALQVYVDDRWHVVYRAYRLSSPTWMPDGSAVWTIATDARGRQHVVSVRVSTTDAGLRAQARTVAVSLVGTGLHEVGRLAQPRLSRDGTRIAVIRTVPDGPRGAPDARPFVARLDATGPVPTLAGLRPLAPQCPALANQRCLTATTDLAWADADHVVALANTNASDPQTRAPYITSVDGSAVQTVGTAGLSSTVTSITAAPGVPMIAVAPGDGPDGPEIFVQSTDSWVQRVNGRAVRYPD